jgi:hypothetical protein
MRPAVFQAANKWACDGHVLDPPELPLFGSSESMIRKSVQRFSVATNAERVCAEIMLNQKPEAR